MSTANLFGFNPLLECRVTLIGTRGRRMTPGRLPQL
jgi:hypothetical protein